jgi:hypothetical protein
MSITEQEYKIKICKSLFNDIIKIIDIKYYNNYNYEIDDEINIKLNEKEKIIIGTKIEDNDIINNESILIIKYYNENNYETFEYYRIDDLILDLFEYKNDYNLD